MRTAPGLHVEWVDDEAVILDPQTNQLHYLNPAAALVYALIEELGFDGAIAEVKDRFSGRDEFEAQLDEVIEGMKEKGLLVD